MTEQQLPEGWQMVKFGDIAKHISKRVEPSETDLEIYVGLEHLDPDSLKIKRHGTPSDFRRFFITYNKMEGIRTSAIYIPRKSKTRAVTGRAQESRKSYCNIRCSNCSTKKNYRMHVSGSLLLETGSE